MGITLDGNGNVELRRRSDIGSDMYLMVARVAKIRQCSSTEAHQYLLQVLKDHIADLEKSKS